MSFKSIGDLAISVLAKLDIEATEEGCASEAHSLRPATGKSGDQLSSREGTAKPVAYAQTRNGLAAQSGIKGGEETVGLTELPQPTRGVFATSYGVRLAYSSKGMPRLSNTTPHRGLGIHLRLVVSH